MMEDLSVKVSTIDLFVKLLIITPAVCSRNVNIDCGYGHISICRELGVQEHVGEQGRYAALHGTGGPQAAAIRLQGGHLGAGLPTLLHGLPVTTLLNLEGGRPCCEA